MQNYDFLLSSAFPVALIQAAGVNIYYKSGVVTIGDPTQTGVRVKGEGGGLDIVLMPGEGITLPVAQSRFTLQRPAVGVQLNGTFLIGNGQFSASRVQGDMTVLNGASLGDTAAVAPALRQWVNTDRLCVGTRDYVSGGGSNSFGFRLRNPVGSGVLLVCNRVVMDRTGLAPQGAEWGWLGAGPATTATYGGVGPEQTVLAQDGLASVGLVSYYSAAWAFAASMGNNLLWRIGPSGNRYGFETRGDIVLRAGEGISCGFVGFGTTETLMSRFEWLERAP